ncbi:MAG: ABC transporter ATP-binding protein [Patescibacteria group bacterium]|nr:ABC transporter ATP-binding protein [Patescibacteria group bacterium]
MLLSLTNVTKQYQLGTTVIKALNSVSIDVAQGEFVSIMGPSGSGKSTFLQVASMLAEPTSGSIKLKDKNVTEYNEVERARLRNKEIGFIFQQFNLLARTSALNNVKLPLMYAGIKEDEQNQRARAMLDRVGLSDRLQNTPAQLSGGQQQRVAVARALINNPSIIFADEPTGNLDSKSGREIINLLKKLSHEGKTIIMVTHEPAVARIAHRLITFHDGQVANDSLKRHPTPISRLKTRPPKQVKNKKRIK